MISIGRKGEDMKIMKIKEWKKCQWKKTTNYEYKDIKYPFGIINKTFSLQRLIIFQLN